MRAVFSLNRHRYRQRLGQLLLIFSLTAVSLVAAIYLGNQPVVLGRIAVIGEVDLPPNGPFIFTTVDQEPTNAEFMTGKFDGYLALIANGEYQISTPKKKEMASVLRQWLAGTQPVEDNQILSKVIGFMMMFLLMGGLNFSALIGEDKEQHQLERLLISPLPLKTYLISQCLNAFLLLYLPTMGLLLVIQGIFRQELGASLLTYSGLIALICALGVSFGTLMMSAFKTSDTANMIGSATLVLSTVVSGSFGIIGKEHQWFTSFSQLFPQKSLLSLATISEGRIFLQTGYLIHVVCSSCLFLLGGILILGKKLKN